MELIDVVMKLTGPIEPVGDTNIDAIRFENLESLLALMRDLHMKIDGLVTDNNGYKEYSIRRAVEAGNNYLDWLGIEE